MLRTFFSKIRDLEPACKEAYLAADSELAIISIGAAALVVPPMAFLDYYYYGLSNDFYGSVIGEVLFAVFSIGMASAISRNRQVKTYEALAFTWGLATSLFALAVTVLQPSRVVENLQFCLLFFIANFITVQNRFLFRMVLAAIVYLAFLAALLTNHTWFTFPDRYMLTLTLLMLTVVGVSVVARNNHFKLTTFALQTREREARLAYAALAGTDSLTGIPNRRSFYEHAELEWNRHKRFASTFCIAIVDLDRFKHVNDTYGHAVGDEVLKRFSSLMAAQARSTDFFARVGGEEFGFVLTETRQGDALRAVARLRDKLQLLKLPALDLEFKITFSAGVAQVGAEDRDLDETIRRADGALYRAKELGRDRIEQG
jgi:diguanylate cyclase (GGDEF)-like protein